MVANKLSWFGSHYHLYMFYSAGMATYFPVKHSMNYSYTSSILYYQ